MWGIIPAAGRGSRIQPLAFSKELLPVGSRVDQGIERPCAVSEYLVERMMLGGAEKIAFVISPGKSDIMEYYGSGQRGVATVYVVQPSAEGLCDAIFRAAPLIAADEEVLVGLPDTVWFPKEGFAALPDGGLSFLLFPVDQPQFFDAVVLDDDGHVREIQVKRQDAASHWIWGAFKLSGWVLHALHDLWLSRDKADEFIGTLVNAYIAAGGEAIGIKAGESYVDVGTFNGYRSAIGLLSEAADMQLGPAPGIAAAAGRRGEPRSAGPLPQRPLSATPRE
jgi:dTDP-glucose pyrophosphorylase